MRHKRYKQIYPGIHNRRTIRLPHYDYGQAGAYFITVCVKDRICKLGEVVGEDVALSAEGKIVQSVWDELPEHYSHVELDEFVVMPNHVHGIVWIKEREEANVGARHASPLRRPRGFKSGSLGSTVASFKSAATRKINQLHKTTGTPFWQRGYYEHIIRNDEDLQQHRKHIQENPLKWSLDEYYREATYA
ncbi:MAG: transposase [Anaerolineae bacterium]|nr:transposase [Anaerolineae bacterium]